MSEFNPYKPAVIGKTKFPPIETVGYPLATRWQRFAGNFVDSILLAVVAMIVYATLLGAYGLTIDPTYFETEMIEPRHMQDYLVETLIGVTSLSVAYLLLNAYLLATRGQTIGKLLLKTRIVDDLDEQIVPLRRVFFRRHLWLFVVAFLPIVGNIVGLIDALAIFGEEKKCIHDITANTRVISLR